MTAPTSLALTGFIAWTLLLLVLMEILRARLVLTGRVASDRIVPDNTNLSPFMQRLARAHLNCIEGLAVFGGLLVVALLTGHAGVTDPLAPWLLAARLLQSGVHLVSTRVVAVNVRFGAFAVQMAIGVYWAVRLLLDLA